MTETKKKGAKKKPQGQPIERTRETNPIYQGTYTIKEYLEDAREGRFTTRERIEFIQRFSMLGPEEWERLETIDTKAKAQYHGPTAWEVGELFDVPEYLPGNITPLDYYRTFYELDDKEAVAKRLEQIQGMAEYMEVKDRVYHLVQRRINEAYPEYMETVREYTALIEKTRLGVTKEAEELKEAMIKTSDTVIYVYPGKDINLDDPIKDSIEGMRGQIEALKLLVPLSYDELAQDKDLSRVLEALESLLSEDTFNEEFQAFRLAHEGEGYRDAIVRIMWGMVWQNMTIGGAFDYIINNPDMLKRQCESAINSALFVQKSLKDDLETYRAYITGEAPTDHTETKERKGPTTLEIARRNPNIPRTNVIVSHGPLTNELGHKTHDKEIVQTKLTESKEFERMLLTLQHNRDANITIKHGIETLPGITINAWHLTIMSAITSMIIERNPKAFYNGAWEFEPMDILETELIARCYGIDRKSVTKDHKEKFREDMKVIGSAWYRSDWGEYMAHNPVFRDTVNKAFPGTNGRVWIHLMDFDYYETPDENGFISLRYKINRFPILDFLDINTGMASKLRYSIKEAPVIPWESVPDKIKGFIEDLATHKTPTIQLYKEDRDGKRYIPALQTREKSIFMDCILRELETYNRHGWIDNTKFFDMDLDRIYEDVWRDSKDTSKKIRIQRKTALLSYIYRLWIRYETEGKDRETAQVYGVTVLTKGPGWPKVRIYLREPLEEIPAIMKDPAKATKKKA